MSRSLWGTRVSVCIACLFLLSAPTYSQTQAQCIYTEVAAAFPEDDDNILIFGLPNQPGSVGRFDIEDDELELADDPLGDLFGTTITRVDDEEYLLVGAPGPGGEPNPLSLFDADDLEAEEFGHLQVARREFTATLVDRDVLIAGGQGADGRGTAGVELIDVGDEEVRAAPEMGQARYAHAAVRLADGPVLVVGGRLSFSEPEASAERYDPEARAWAPAGELAVGRSRATASILGNGRVLVVGGQGGEGRRQAEIDMYDPVGNVWGVLPPLLEARFGHRAVTLADGNLLIVGGESVPAERVAILFDPVALDWTVTPPPPERVSTGVPVVMSDGAVFIVGGTCQQPGDPVSIQRYSVFPPD